tara:strand:+ start:887 stop:1033 length:147 start_codon:yes stop_codon:yes gene_type:complete
MLVEDGGSNEAIGVAARPIEEDAKISTRRDAIAKYLPQGENVTEEGGS